MSRARGSGGRDRDQREFIGKEAKLRGRDVPIIPPVTAPGADEVREENPAGSRAPRGAGKEQLLQGPLPKNRHLGEKNGDSLIGIEIFQPPAAPLNFIPGFTPRKARAEWQKIVK